MQLPATKKVVPVFFGFIVASVFAQSQKMAAGGVLAAILCTPVALLIDWRGHVSAKRAAASKAEADNRPHHIAYHKRGEDPGCIIMADGVTWDEFGYPDDGWYVYVGCGEPGCCRPAGPFECKRVAEAFSVSVEKLLSA